MEEIKSLVEKFLSGMMTAPDFSWAYLDLWRVLSDEMHTAEARHPELKREELELWDRRRQGLIDDATFWQKYRALAAKMHEGCRIQLFTRESDLVDDLFNAAERYDIPEIQRGSTLYIGEAELVEEVKRAMSKFNAQP